MSNITPPGGPPHCGYPQPPAPGAFSCVPTPAVTPVCPPPVPQHDANCSCPPPCHRTGLPSEFVMSDNVIEWVPSTRDTASSLDGRAFVAGREGGDGGSPLWIMRSTFNGDFIPGKLAVSHRAAYVPYNGMEMPVYNLEVLCAPPNAVCWVPETNGRVPADAILAGNTLKAEPLYIGRVPHMRSITPGKVQPNHGCCYISFNGKELSFKSYEVLCKVNC